MIFFTRYSSVVTKIYSSRITRWSLILLILLVAFVLRLAAFDHPLAINSGEGFRDLLVAKHALLYGEWPTTGYSNGLSFIDNSPLYYYIIILFVWLGSTFLNVGILHILFQCFFILLVFLLARTCFGWSAALVTALLLAIAPDYIVTSATFLWPPYFMPPFVTMSFLSLWYGYQKNKKFFTSLSLIIMMMALAVHQSALPLFLPFGILLLYVTNKNKFTIREYLNVGLMTSVTFVIFFLPSILQANTLLWGTRLHTDHAVSSSEGLLRIIHGVPNIFGLFSNFPGRFEGFLSFAFLFLFGYFFSSHTIGVKKKVLVSIILVSISIQMLAAVIVDPEGIPRHLASILWMIPMLVGVILAYGFERSRIVAVLSSVVLLLLVISSLCDLRLTSIYGNIGVFNRPHETMVTSAVNAMVDEIEAIKKDKHYDDYTFFDIHALAGAHFYVSPLIFWLPLEERFGVELARSPNRILKNFNPAHFDDYVFYACFKRYVDDTIAECLDEFIREMPPDSQLQKEIFFNKNLTIYLVAKKR